MIPALRSKTCCRTSGQPPLCCRPTARAGFDCTSLTVVFLAPPGLCGAGAVAVRHPHQVNQTLHQVLHSTRTQLAKASELEVFTPSARQAMKLKLSTDPLTATDPGKFRARVAASLSSPTEICLGNCNTSCPGWCLHRDANTSI